MSALIEQAPPTGPKVTLTAAELEACARAAHEVNRAYCVALGDTSHAAWSDSPAWQTDSVHLGVRGVLFDGLGPEASHALWLAEKERTGWVYGPTKDPVAKTHPCVMPYDDLPAHQRHKDMLFGTVVLAVARSFGFCPKAVEDRRVATAILAALPHEGYIAVVDCSRDGWGTFLFVESEPGLDSSMTVRSPSGFCPPPTVYASLSVARQKAARANKLSAGGTRHPGRVIDLATRTFVADTVP